MLVDLEREVRDILARGLTTVEPANPDAKTLEALASLGYAGGSDGTLRPGNPEQEMALVGYDPKDLVDVSMGAREIQNGFYESGEKKLLRFFGTAPTPEEDPRMARLWAAARQNYAKIWMLRGQYAEAAEQYRLGQLADPSYDLARWSRIYALNLAGDPARADAEAEETLARWPRSHRVSLHRALAQALAGDIDRALATLDFVAREADPDGEIASAARWYRERIADTRRDEALAAYLATESRRRAGAGPVSSPEGVRPAGD